MRLKFEMYRSHCREICSGSCSLHFSDSQNRVAIATGNVQGIGEFPNGRFVHMASHMHCSQSLHTWSKKRPIHVR